jgi:formate hydrogenlyase subunit 4
MFCNGLDGGGSCILVVYWRILKLPMCYLMLHHIVNLSFHFILVSLRLFIFAILGSSSTSPFAAGGPTRRMGGFRGGSGNI